MRISGILNLLQHVENIRAVVTKDAMDFIITTISVVMDIILFLFLLFYCSYLFVLFHYFFQEDKKQEFEYIYLCFFRNLKFSAFFSI